MTFLCQSFGLPTNSLEGACGVFVQANVVVTFGAALGVVMYRPTKERWMGNQDWHGTWMEDWNPRFQQHWSTLGDNARKSKQD
jgi:hypothetical protein